MTPPVPRRELRWQVAHRAHVSYTLFGAHPPRSAGDSAGSVACASVAGYTLAEAQPSCSAELSAGSMTCAARSRTVASLHALTPGALDSASLADSATLAGVASCTLTSSMSYTLPRGKPSRSAGTCSAAEACATNSCPVASLIALTLDSGVRRRHRCNSTTSKRRRTHKRTHRAGASTSTRCRCKARAGPRDGDLRVAAEPLGAQPRRRQGNARKCRAKQAQARQGHSQEPGQSKSQDQSQKPKPEPGSSSAG